MYASKVATFNKRKGKEINKKTKNVIVSSGHDCIYENVSNKNPCGGKAVACVDLTSTQLPSAWLCFTSTGQIPCKTLLTSPGIRRNIDLLFSMTTKSQM